jgi:Ca-activated chloride channel family protein
MNKKFRILIIAGLVLVVAAVAVMALALTGSNEARIFEEQDQRDAVGDLYRDVDNEAYDGALAEASESLAEPAREQAAQGGSPQQQAAQMPSATMVAAAPEPNQPAEPPADMFFENSGTNPFLDTEDDNLSTFAMDVDTASYTVARNYLMNFQQLPPAESIRPEEFINFFDAHYDSPDDEHAFAIHMEAAPAPFGYEGHYLLRVGVQGRYIAPEDRTAAFLIFVIDVSGSMDMENRLGLVKESLALLVDELREDDRVAIVVYSDNSRVVLNPTPASESHDILDAINALHPEGSTNVDAGLRLGYDLAQSHMREGEITRVVVLSDGVANVDTTSPDGILRNISEGVDSGVTLSTIGFGMGNYNDVLMEQLANDGNGSYYYIDNLRQARRVFVHNLTGTLQVIGYDAKIQVEFNPEVADRYRLIGYENRAIADEDFRNDTVDAGEVGAGHSITALYEVALEDDDLSPADLIATAYIRYEDADTREVVELQQGIAYGQVMDSIDEAAPTFRLQVAVAEFAELLRGSFWAEEGNYVDLLTFAAPLESEMIGDEDVAEFMQMLRLAGRFVDTGR